LILGILQARMSSTRLPGKVMAPVLGQPMIGRQIERVSRSRRIDQLVVATSLDPSDDPLADWCASAGVEVFRGDLGNVLARFAGVLRRHPQATTVVRLTADCPLADWTVIDELVDLHVAQAADYSNNVAPERTFPHGLDAEAMRPDALLAAAAEAADPYEREHVTPFLYRRPDRYRLGSVVSEDPAAELRWTVDTPADLEFVRHVYATLYPGDPAFSSAAIRALPRNSSL